MQTRSASTAVAAAASAEASATKIPAKKKRNRSSDEILIEMAIKMEAADPTIAPILEEGAVPTSSFLRAERRCKRIQLRMASDVSCYEEDELKKVTMAPMEGTDAPFELAPPAKTVKKKKSMNSDEYLIEMARKMEAASPLFAPIKEEDAAATSSYLMGERRRTRIQMRMAKEESCYDEDERMSTREVTHPPYNPSNCEKVEARETNDDCVTEMTEKEGNKAPFVLARADNKHSKKKKKPMNSDEYLIEMTRKMEAADPLFAPALEEGTAATSSYVMTERRSTRIQMRMAIEASCFDEDERRKVTSTPAYPSNCEKLREARETREMFRRASSMAPTTTQKRQHSADVLIDAATVVARTTSVTATKTVSKVASKRSYSKGGKSARRSASNDSLVASQMTPRRVCPPAHLLLTAAVPTTVAAAPSPSPPQPTYTPSVPQGSRPHPRRAFTSPSSSPQMSPTTIAAMSTTTAQMMYRRPSSAAAPAAATPPPPPMPSISHYPLLNSLYGTSVHQRQETIAVPASHLYPAPLSIELLRTMYHPAWLRPKQQGADEKRAIALYGHSHLMLPARMYHMDMMLERCMQALQDTSMPLPPLQPLLPSPCPALGYTCSDPLTDVLDSLPSTPLQPYIYPTHRACTAPEALYTTAFQSARNHVPSKSDDRKWWEVRTFASFDGLRTFGPSLADPKFVRPPTTVTYAMADRNTRIHHTYVTSKRPIFSVHESPRSQPMQQHAARSVLTDRIDSPPPPTRAASAATCTYGIAQSHGSRPSALAFSPRSATAASSSRPRWSPPTRYPSTPAPPPSPLVSPTHVNAAAAAASSSSLLVLSPTLSPELQRKRPIMVEVEEVAPVVEEEVVDVELVKRARTSFYESELFAKAGPSMEGHDQYELEQWNEEQAVLEAWANETATTVAAQQSVSNCSNRSSILEEIMMVDDGTTFAVL